MNVTMDDRKFEVRCNANDDGQLHVRTNSLSVRVGQLIRRNGTQEMWDSVLIICQVGEDGLLTAKVVVCHPDWGQQLQIANIESHLTDRDKCAPPLPFDFARVHISPVHIGPN
jgi:hypothetical protein